MERETVRERETERGCAHLALDLLGVQQVDEHLEAAHVADRELTRLLRQVKVAHRAQRDHRRCLVPALKHVTRDT